MRDMINKSLELISFFIVSFLFFACTGEQDETGSTAGAGGKVQIALQVPVTGEDAASFTTRSEDANESAIRNLTLFFFDSAGNKEFSTYIDLSNVGNLPDVDMNRWDSDKVITIFNAGILADLSKSRNVHVVANYGDLSRITTETDLNAVITAPVTADISSPTADKPLVLSGVARAHVFATDSKATVSLVRNVAKVQMKLTTIDFVVGGKTVSLAPEGTLPSVKVINQADRSFLVSKGSSPAEVAYFNGEKANITAGSRDGASADFTYQTYINENLRASYSAETNATALVIQIPYRIDGGEINENNYYKILINNVDGESKYKINRNTIYDIAASISTLGGETDASAVLVKGTLNVLPWDENLLESDLTQTFLSVEGSTIHIGVNGVLNYATNALFSEDTRLSECAVTSEASWLTVSLVSENQVNLVASSEDYTVPRTGTFKLKVRNLIKEITVTQSPSPVTNGSISLTPRRLFLPEAPRTASLTVNPAHSRWLKTEGNTAIATCSLTNGEGNKTLTFTNGTSYGNTDYKFANLNTMEYDSIQVCNLHLTVPSSPIEIGGQAGTTDFEDIITALGGDANWVVKSTSDSWLTATNVDQKLRVVATEGPDGQSRTGSIIIAHINDPSYTKTIVVTQLDHDVIYIPNFDYLMFRYNWIGTNGQDLDTATEFINTGLTNVDNRPLGYGLYGHFDGVAGDNQSVNNGTTGNASGPVYLTNPSGQTILAWGGDNVNQNAGETLYINAKSLCNEGDFVSLPTEIYIDLYAIWWTTKSDDGKPIKVEMTAYKGGEMKRYPDSAAADIKKNFYNEGGTVVYGNAADPPTREIQILKSGVYKEYRTWFVPVARVTFNKKTAQATVEMYNTLPRRLATKSMKNIPQQLNGESKDEYSLRIEKYYNNQK